MYRLYTSQARSYRRKQKNIYKRLTNHTLLARTLRHRSLPDWSSDNAEHLIDQKQPWTGMYKIEWLNKTMLFDGIDVAKQENSCLLQKCATNTTVDMVDTVDMVVAYFSSTEPH